MPIPNSARQDRIARIERAQKRPGNWSRTTIQVVILQAYDADVLDEKGVPAEAAHIVKREPGTMFAYVRAIKSKRKFYVPFMASEADIISNHGNAVLLRGSRGTITFSGLRPEEGRLVLLGEPTRPLRNRSATDSFDVVSNL